MDHKTTANGMISGNATLLLSLFRVPKLCAWKAGVDAVHFTMLFREIPRLIALPFCDVLRYN